MKNATKLLALLIAVIMVLVCFASCGDKPAETTKAETTKTETTETTKPKTTKPVTTKAPITKATTTTAPVTTRPDYEPVIPAAEHTEHKWFSVPTFTPYAEKKADGTIGELATRCRYEGCTAIKEGNPLPTLIYLDFEGEGTQTISSWLNTNNNRNMVPFHKDTSLTSGKVANGEWTPSWGNSQVMLEDQIQLFKNYQKYTISYDVQIGAFKALLGMTFYSSTDISYYACQVRINEATGSIELCRGTSTALPLEGTRVEMNGWYRFEMEITSYTSTPAVSTMNVYMSTWLLDENGNRMGIDPKHEHEFLGSISGIPVEDPNPSDPASKQSYDDYFAHLEAAEFGGFRIGYQGSIKTLDNFAVTVPYVAGSHEHKFGTVNTVNFDSPVNGVKGYKWAQCTIDSCAFAQVTPILENGSDGSAAVTDFVCAANNCGCRLATVENVAASCEAGSKIVTTCVKCGNAITVPGEISALGHLFGVTQTVEPSCGIDGYIIETCSRCKITRKTVTDPMTQPHELKKVYKEYTAADKPEGSKAVGYYEVSCTKCHYSAKEEVLVKLDFNNVPEGKDFSEGIASWITGFTGIEKFLPFAKYIDEAANVSVYTGLPRSAAPNLTKIGLVGTMENGKLGVYDDQLFFIDDLQMFNLSDGPARQFTFSFKYVPGSVDNGNFFMVGSRTPTEAPGTWVFLLSLKNGELNIVKDNGKESDSTNTGFILEADKEYALSFDVDLSNGTMAVYVDGVRAVATAGNNTYVFNVANAGKIDATREDLWKFNKAAGRTVDDFEVSYVSETAVAPHTLEKNYVAYTEQTKPTGSSAIGYFETRCTKCDYTSREEVLVKLDFDTVPEGKDFSEGIASWITGFTGIEKFLPFAKYIDDAANVSVYTGLPRSAAPNLTKIGLVGTMENGKLGVYDDQLFFIDDLQMFNLTDSPARQFTFSFKYVPGSVADGNFFMVGSRTPTEAPGTWVFLLALKGGELNIVKDNGAYSNATNTGFILEADKEYALSFDVDLDNGTMAVYVDGVRAVATAGNDSYVFNVANAGKIDATREDLWKFNKADGRTVDDFEVSYVAK